MQVGHLLVLLNTALLVPITMHYFYLLGKTGNGSAEKWLGFFGAVFAVFGTCMMAANKGFLYVTMTALDGFTEEEFEQVLPGLEAIFSFEGWMFLVWSCILLALGVLLQIVAMMRASTLPQWQLRLLFVGVLCLGFPDGAEIVNLVAAILMAIAMIPYGIQLIMTAPNSSIASDGFNKIE
jgi:hypothetical protein